MATAKQLAALKKARAARAKKKPVAKKPARKTVRKSNPVKRASAPTQYAVEVMTKNGETAYFSRMVDVVGKPSGVELDTLVSRALKTDLGGAKAIAAMLMHSNKGRILSAKAVIVGTPPGK